jgi:aminoglycoside 6'-N-acetyltransferase I
LKIAPPHDSRDRDWLAMRLILWPEASSREHLSSMADAIAREHFVRIAYGDDGSAIGFVETSKRVDYVNGTESSPVAFLEGIYVVPEYRHRGVARTLANEAAQWGLAQGCREFASDSLLSNVDAHSVHVALGFEETERVVYFRKKLVKD